MTNDRKAVNGLAARVRNWPWATTLKTLVQRFREDRLALTAGGLTFTTIISIVPLVTVMLALFSAFPIFGALQQELQSYFVQTLVPDTIARPVMNAINQFSTRASRLGLVGLVALVFSSLAMMLTIDRALNAIWRVRNPRRIAHRVLIYWAAMTLGPILLAISVGATSYGVTASRGWLGDLPAGLGIAVGSVEFAFVVVAVSALFHYVPNTYVRWRHAVLGGFFVAVCIAAGKRAMTAYFGAVPTYSMVYGTFATLPIFLVWIYLSWAIVLLGAVLAAYTPLFGSKLGRWREAAGAQFHLALIAIAELERARSDDDRGRSAEQLASAIGVDPVQVDPILEALVGIDWVGRLDESGNPRYVLLIDPKATPAEPLIARLLLDPAPDLQALWERARFGSLKLAEIGVG